MFFVFRARTMGYNFVEDLLFGGARYIATGRAFALQRSSFVHVRHPPPFPRCDLTSGTVESTQPCLACSFEGRCPSSRRELRIA